MSADMIAMHRIWLLALCVLVACNPSSDKVEPEEGTGEITADNIRSESFGVTYIFSDSSYIKAELYSAHVIERVEEIDGGEEVVHYLRDTVRVKFFDRSGIAHSFVTSKEGTFRKLKRLAELKEDVVLWNLKGEQLETEQLFWNERKDSVYTDKFVRIETPDKIITGSDGLVSNTSFTSWTIFGTRGEVEVEEENP